MNLWWLSNSTRLGQERAAINFLALDGWFVDSKWTVNDFRLCVEGSICILDAQYPVRLIYADQFPSVPAWVEPVDSDVRWSAHQYGRGGPLCLELRPDNWRPEATGADVLRSAYNLLRIERHPSNDDPAVAPSSHLVGEVQDYANDELPVLMGSAFAERLLGGDASKIMAVRSDSVNEIWPILVTDAIDRLSLRRIQISAANHVPLRVTCVASSAELPHITQKNDVETSLGISLPIDETNSHLVLVLGVGGIKALHIYPNGNAFARKIIVLPDETGKRTGRSETLLSKSVAIVGLGSIGSKVAESIVRAGVSSLVLVDGDILLPDNLERHALDWRDVGYHKALAARRRLLHIVPGANIRVIRTNLNWQQSSRIHSRNIEAIAACDLIVDATGDAPTAMLLGSLATANKKAFVTVEVFEGGLGCSVARCVPGLDKDFALARAAFLAYCDERNTAPPASGRKNYESLTENGLPLVADDAAVSIAAGNASHIILEILENRSLRAEDSWILLGFRTGWLFSKYGHNISLDLSAGDKQLPSSTDKEAYEFGLEIAEEALRALKSQE